MTPESWTNLWAIYEKKHGVTVSPNLRLLAQTALAMEMKVEDNKNSGVGIT